MSLGSIGAPERLPYVKKSVGRGMRIVNTDPVWVVTISPPDFPTRDARSIWPLSVPRFPCPALTKNSLPFPTRRTRSPDSIITGPASESLRQYRLLLLPALPVPSPQERLPGLQPSSHPLSGYRGKP